MQIDGALSSGAILITATARQARFWRKRYASRQMAAGRRAWVDPQIFSFADWLERLARRQGGLAVLSGWQEETLWEQAIASEGGGELMQPGAAARAARRSWNLLHAWRLARGGGAWAGSPDGAAFLGWARAYEARVRHMGRTDEARLTEAIQPHDAGEVLVAGPDEVEPAAALFWERMSVAGTRVRFLPGPPEKAGHARVAACSDSGDEIEAAAQWARERLETDVAARIGVAFLDLESVRGQVEHTFRAAVGSAVHISLGPPLTERPLIAGALAVLALALERMSTIEWTSLLLSPWIAGEPISRAKLDMEMRRKRMESAPIADVARMGSCPAAFRERLGDAMALIEGWPERQSPGTWSAAWARLLTLMGWPGEALSSGEYQILESAWHGALSDFAALDATVGNLPASSALAMFHRELGRRRFQVEDLGEPVQVMGLEEAAALDFDHLWVAGLHDEAWPAPASPDPFVPQVLQRSHGLPHCSAAWELERAQRLTQGLAGAAGEVVFSYPRMDGEKRLSASPLVRAFGEAEAISPAPFDWGAARLDEIADEVAPGMSQGTLIAGGTRMLELQAQCPFRAFAEMRLGADAMETPELGYDYRERGIILHAALEACWEELGSSAALSGALEEIVDRAAGRALDAHAPGNPFQAKRLELEQERLRRLLLAWLAVERKRGGGFTVIEAERDREVEIGGIRLRTRMDRMDRMENGGDVVLIDYKSTAPSPSAWEGDRPDSPQLPLYAVTSGVELAGALFAQVRAGDTKFTGVVTRTEVAAIHGVVTPEEFNERMAGWRAAIEGLASQVRQGVAAVDPKKGDETCGRCHLSMLCRIHES